MGADIETRVGPNWGRLSKIVGLAIYTVMLQDGPLKGQSFTFSTSTAQSRIQQPFGFGTIRQTMVQSGALSGNQICRNQWGTSWKCFAVSGDNLCSDRAPVGEMVSCNPSSTPQVDQSAFVPQYNCNGQLQGPVGKLGSGDWCLIAGLQATLVKDSIYLMDDWVRIGLDRRFGGTVFELYGTDKKNRIMENGGGAIQLSLWGEGASQPASGPYSGWFRQPQSDSQCSATIFSSQQECEQNGAQCSGGVMSDNTADCTTQFACADNGANAGAPLNPIQGISRNCSYGITDVSNDEARVDQVFSPEPNVVVMTKTGPQDFQKSSNSQLTGLFWTETAHTNGPFAMLSYHISYESGPALTFATQEFPAIWLNDGFNNGVLYYYDGPRPYTDAKSEVTQAISPTGQTIYSHFFLPKRSRSLDTLIQGQGANLTEDWISLCDATSTKCITLASFSPEAHDVTYIPQQDSYFSVHGDFAMSPGLSKTLTLWIAPYRWDDVVDGYTVRQWIYMIGNKLPSPTKAVSKQTRSLIDRLEDQSKSDSK